MPRGAMPALAFAALLGGCARQPQRGADRLRLGFMPNLTHAAALTGLERGTFVRALTPLSIETKVFSAGPQIIEAIFAGAIDAAYVGPGPAENGFVRSNGRALVIVAGAASGGAGLVVRHAASIHEAADLRGKRLATPQIGNTQDVALRNYLADHGIRTSDRGGDTLVLPLAPADILNLMRHGSLDGAWVAEPWVTRLVEEAGGTVLVDERALWPNGQFITAVLLASRDALLRRRDTILSLIRAHVQEVEWIRQHPREARSTVRTALAHFGRIHVPQPLVDRSFDSIEVTTDVSLPILRQLAERAHRLGYLPASDERALAGLVDTSLLDQVLAEAGDARRSDRNVSH